MSEYARRKSDNFDSHMIHTDKYYVKPTVYMMTTNLADKLIQLDGWVTPVDYKQPTTEDTLPNTYLKPVSYVSNDAGVYPDIVNEVIIHAQL